MEEAIAPEAQVETTTPESAPETETPSETATAPADVSDQPVEEAPRAEKRIHELSKRLKESEQRADYWERLNATPPVAPTDEPQEFYTADQIAESIIRKQKTELIESQKVEANRELQEDIQQTLDSHPDLNTNDKLSKAVFAYAQSNNMRISDAANEIKAQIKADEDRIKKELLATQSGRIGVTTPSGGRVSTGSDRVSLESMSDEDKANNWGKILQSYQE
jgi:hypothetical protein